MLTLTDSALNAIGRFITATESDVAGLRVSVTSGGCSGFQYSMGLEEQIGTEDVVIAIEDLRILVDQSSASLLEGVTIDFVENIDGSGFTFSNPNATASCGCGKSFAA